MNLKIFISKWGTRFLSFNLKSLLFNFELQKIKQQFVKLDFLL